MLSCGLDSGFGHDFLEVDPVTFEELNLFCFFAHEGQDDGESGEFLGDFARHFGHLLLYFFGRFTHAGVQDDDGEAVERKRDEACAG